MPSLQTVVVYLVCWWYMCYVSDHTSVVVLQCQWWEPKFLFPPYCELKYSIIQFYVDVCSINEMVATSLCYQGITRKLKFSSLLHKINLVMQPGSIPNDLVQRTPIQFHFPAFSSSESSEDPSQVNNYKVSPSDIKFHFPSSSSSEESTRSQLSAFSSSHFHTPLCSNRSFRTAWSIVRDIEPSPIPCKVLPF